MSGRPGLRSASSRAAPPHAGQGEPQPAAAAAPAPAPSRVQLDLVVPSGNGVGDKLQIQTPLGTFNFVVPVGAAAGKRITITLPAELVPPNYVTPRDGVPVTKIVTLESRQPPPPPPQPPPPPSPPPSAKPAAAPPAKRAKRAKQSLSDDHEMRAIQKDSVIDDLQQYHRLVGGRGHLGMYRLIAPDYNLMASFVMWPRSITAYDLYKEAALRQFVAKHGQKSATAEVQRSIQDRAEAAWKALCDDALRGWTRDDPTTWMPADQLYDRIALGAVQISSDVAAAAWGATSRVSDEK